MAELKFFGAGCFEIKTKDAVVVIDPYDKSYAKPITVKDKIVLQTDRTKAGYAESSFVIDRPGEYEISKVSVNGIAVRLISDVHEADPARGTLYRIVLGDTTLGVLGNIDPNLSDEQLEALGVVDYLIVPVGGNGLSIEPADAAKLVRSIEPKVVLASHFADDSINYPVPQQEVTSFAKELGIEVQSVNKLKLSHGNLSEELELIVLDRN